MNSKWAWILGISFIVAAIAFGIFFFAARQQADTIRVVGYAVRDYEADLVKWSFALTANSGLGNPEEGHRAIGKKLEKFRKAWGILNLDVEDMIVHPVNTQNTYGMGGEMTGYTFQQRITVTSKAIESIEQLSIDPKALLDQGISVEYSNLEYFSTELGEIKKDLLAEATQDARERAEKIVSLSGRTLSKMTSARSGIFQITEPYSTEVSDYGMYSTSTRKKSIKVTVSAVFEMAK